MKKRLKMLAKQQSCEQRDIEVRGQRLSASECQRYSMLDSNRPPSKSHDRSFLPRSLPGCVPCERLVLNVAVKGKHLSCTFVPVAHSHCHLSCTFVPVARSHCHLSCTFVPVARSHCHVVILLYYLYLSQREKLLKEHCLNNFKSTY